MPTLLLHFPGGRYHATPYGHHVNEGLVEWPPSPWRLLRALIACGYATQGWRAVPPVARRLIEKLVGTLPRYRLPAASIAHSRHYMPILKMDEKKREKTTLVFDTWAHVGDGSLAVHWDCALEDRETEMFHTLAGNLSYLGRSESWVLAETICDDVELPAGFQSFPNNGERPAGPGWEQVSLLAAEPSEDYVAWREQSVEAALKGLPLPDGKRKPPKKLKKDRARDVAAFPDDIIDCLQKDTSWWKGHGWSQPPGSRRVLYWRRHDALSVGPPVQVSRRTSARVTTMLLALTTPSGNRSALPPCTRTLPQAELIHRALVRRTGKGRQVDCPELTGKDSAGNPLTGHRHAHVWPLDLDHDGHLDHVLIHTPMGLGADAQRAVRGLRRTWTGGIGDLHLALAGQGEITDLYRLPSPLSDGIAAVLGPPTGASVWRSITPLVLPRYPKRRGKNTIEGQVLAELASRGLPPASVEVLPSDEETRRFRHYVRIRQYPAPQAPVDVGFAVRLTFGEPIQGPVALGYASHFGLGLFAAQTVSGSLSVGAGRH